MGLVVLNDVGEVSEEVSGLSGSTWCYSNNKAKTDNTEIVITHSELGGSGEQTQDMQAGSTSQEKKKYGKFYI